MRRWSGWWTPSNGGPLQEEQHVTVVFERPPSPPMTSRIIEIAHAPRAAANSADDEIVRLVQAEHDPHNLTVVTSDSALAERVHRAGASTQPAANFRDVIDPVE